MSRELSGSSQYLTIETPVLTAVPITMAAWFKLATVAGYQEIMSLGGRNGTTQEWRLQIQDTSFDLITQDNTLITCSSTAVLETGVWYHGCGVWENNSSRTAYINGADKVNIGGVKTPSPDQIYRTRIGADQGAAAFLEGAIAEVSIWNAALSDEEVETLSLGFSPLLVRPQNLASYVPLIRDNDEDLITGLSWTPVGSPTISAHPRVFYPGMQSHLQSGSGSATANPFGPLIQVT